MYGVMSESARAGSKRSHGPELHKNGEPAGVLLRMRLLLVLTRTIPALAGRGSGRKQRGCRASVEAGRGHRGGSPGRLQRPGMATSNGSCLGEEAHDHS